MNVPARLPPAVAVLRRWGLPALAAGVVGVAGSFAVAGLTVHFVAAPVHAAVVQHTPGVVVTAAILLLGKLGESLAVAVAIGVAVLLLALAALVGIAVGSRLEGAAGAVLGTYFAAWVVTALLIRAPFAALGAAVPMAAAVGIAGLVPQPAAAATARRRVLVAAAGLAGFVGLSTVAGLRVVAPEASSLTAISTAEREVIERRLRTARDRSLDVDGLERLVTPVEDFYEVDIDAVNPDVDAAEWRLRLHGAVASERVVTYGDLTSMDPAHRFNTLRCVGEPLNGRLMDNALWTGVPVTSLLERAGPLESATHVVLRAADGYDEEFPLAALRDGFLAYGMNGRVLPRTHGFPVRALIPGHWGEINVKWLTGIELLDHEVAGYWERRGWHGTGPVNTVAKLHATNRLADGRLQVAGHAYAGVRGVERVEVSVDGGASWADARLSEPLSDADTWRQWVFEWVPTAAEHEVVVRATDGTGRRQPREAQSPFPSGATGWVSRTVRR